MDKIDKLRKRRRTKNNPSRYKIIITGDRCDNDNLSELGEYPERGKRIATFYFSTPDQLDLILAEYEGLFYQLYEVDSLERKGYGVFDDNVSDDWWDDECCCVCDRCFLRETRVKIKGRYYWTCRRGDSLKDIKRLTA